MCRRPCLWRCRAESGLEAAADSIADDTPVWEPPSIVTLEDVLPSPRGRGTLDAIVRAVDQMKWVMTQLSELPSDRRRAFTLHVLDGWEPDEVAMIQGRPVEEVRGDIEEARRMLMESSGQRWRDVSSGRPRPATRNEPFLWRPSRGSGGVILPYPLENPGLKVATPRPEERLGASRRGERRGLARANRQNHPKIPCHSRTTYIEYGFHCGLDLRSLEINVKTKLLDAV
jgi:hypothetical protein